MTEPVPSIGYDQPGFESPGFGSQVTPTQQPASVQLTVTWHDAEGTHQIQASGVMTVTIVHLS